MDEPPAILPFRDAFPPVAPLRTAVTRAATGAGWVTAVARIFPEGTGYCGRCPRDQCCSDGSFCIVHVRGYVASASAPGLTLLGCAWAPREDLPGAGDRAS
jgi:hypothetical protein